MGIIYYVFSEYVIQNHVKQFYIQKSDIWILSFDSMGQSTYLFSLQMLGVGCQPTCTNKYINLCYRYISYFQLDEHSLISAQL